MKSLAFCLVALSSCAVGQAAELPALDRFSLSAGVFDNAFHVEGRVDGRDVAGSERDFSEDFGFDTRRQIDIFEASWLIADRHQIEARYYVDARQRRRAIDESISFDGELFPIQLNLEGRARFSTSELNYAYWWRSDSATPLAAQIGVLRLAGLLGLRGRLLVEDVGEVEGSASVSEHVYAPVIGLAARHAFGSRWRAFAEVRFIELDIKRISGHVWAGRVGAEFLPTRHTAIVAQYAGSRWDARRPGEDFAGELEIGFQGPQLLLKLRF